MRRSLVAVTLIAGLLSAGCSSGAAPTPQIIYVTQPPATAAPSESAGIAAMSASPLSAASMPAPTPTQQTKPTTKPKATPLPTKTPKPKAWSAAFRSQVCASLFLLYEITPLTDAAGAAEGQGDLATTRADVVAASGLALQAQAGLVGLPSWPPGDTLVALVKSAANDLGYGGATFVTGLDSGNADQALSGLHQMASGGAEVTSAQNEMDALGARY